MDEFIFPATVPPITIFWNLSTCQRLGGSKRFPELILCWDRPQKVSDAPPGCWLSEDHLPSLWCAAEKRVHRGRRAKVQSPFLWKGGSIHGDPCWKWAMTGGFVRTRLPTYSRVKQRIAGDEGSWGVERVELMATDLEHPQYFVGLQEFGTCHAAILP